MCMGKRLTVGVLIGNAHTSHPTGLINGICDSAKGRDVNVVFFLGTQSTAFYKQLAGKREDFDYQYNTIYDYAMLANVDVLIIAYGSLCIFEENHDLKRFLERFSGVPYILLEDVAPDDQDVYLIADNYDGMRQCVEHMILEHDYRKICYLSGPKDNRDAMERLKAYRDTMGKYGRFVGTDMVAYGNYSEYVDDIVEELFEKNPDVDAIISANDEMTTAVYRVCEQHGMQVGCDIGVTGFDNTERSGYADPPLTTIAQDSYNMGRIAFEKACNIASGKTETSARLPVDFIQRESCGCSNRILNKEEQEEERYVNEMKLRDTVEELRQFQHKAWMGPFLMRDLMQETRDEKHFFSKAVKALHEVGARSVQIYMLKRPLIYKKGSKWKAPTQLYLAARYHKNKVTTYDAKDRPVMDLKHGGMFADKSSNDRAYTYMNFLLFEGMRQYGIMSLEIDPDAISYFYLLSLQFGTSLRFFEMSRREIESRQKLKEKNEVLGVIASYDELTGIYNRRGIMENLVEFNHAHAGERAYLLIGDLDHLKQINDIYGHTEGDCAIRTCAGILKEVLGEYGDIGRFGGDEFIAVFLDKEELNRDIFIQTIHGKCEIYNENSGKPYYVNLSMGAVEFVCGEKNDFKEMLRHADAFLYQAKQSRRKSICKDEV